MEGDRASKSEKPIRDYRDLEVWQKAMDLVVTVYHTSVALPSTERFALTDQIHRAAVSIPSNIAEGHGRLHRPDFLRFLSMARGSLMELQMQVEIAFRLNYLTSQQQAQIRERCQEVGRLLNGLIRSLRNPLTPDPRPLTPDPRPLISVAINEARHDKMVELVERMLVLHKRLHGADSRHTRHIEES